MIDEKTVKHVASIAKINLTKDEINKFSKQLNDIVSNFKILDELKVDDVKPSFHPIRTENVLREDKVEKTIKREEVLKLANHKEDVYFKAPKTI